MLRTWASLLVLGLFTACAGGPSPETDVTSLPPQFTRSAYADLPGWSNERLDGFVAASQKSCARMSKQSDATPVKHAGTVADWRLYCADIMNPRLDARETIQKHLVPWRVTTSGSKDGLFTGYYEAALNGSRTRHGPFQTPIRGRPLDHVTADLGAFKDSLKGQKITGQLIGKPGAYTLKPYPDRAGINDGAIPTNNDEILAWVDDPVDAFFLEIQGSGQIALDDGTTLHVGYAEKNGQGYTAIGKILVERGSLTKDTVSMQTIRAWLEAHPDQATDLMNANRSYVFFREMDGSGPVGAETVTLTPMRSLAIDKAMWSYGMPFYIDAASPSGDARAPRLQRLFMGQDTGGAIKGAIRGDVFWGAGSVAETTAGVMKSRGGMWVLLPKYVVPQ